MELLCHTGRRVTAPNHSRSAPCRESLHSPARCSRRLCSVSAVLDTSQRSTGAQEPASLAVPSQVPCSTRTGNFCMTALLSDALMLTVKAQGLTDTPRILMTLSFLRSGCSEACTNHFTPTSTSAKCQARVALVATAGSAQFCDSTRTGALL